MTSPISRCERWCPVDARSLKMAQHCLALVIILLGITTTQVNCGYESVVMIVRPRTSSDVCYNTTTHPTKFEDCPPPPFTVLSVNYEHLKAEVRILYILPTCTKNYPGRVKATL